MGPPSYLAWGRWFGEAFFITGADFAQRAVFHAYNLRHTEVALHRFVPSQVARIATFIKEDRYKLDLGNRNVDWIVLFFYGIGLRLLTYITFRVLNRARQR